MTDPTNPSAMDNGVPDLSVVATAEPSLVLSTPVIPENYGDMARPDEAHS
jgi:hypothetical protein